VFVLCGDVEAGLDGRLNQVLAAPLRRFVQEL
jgi:hypothetical protein